MHQRDDPPRSRLNQFAVLDDGGIVWCVERPMGPARCSTRLGRLLLRDYPPASDVVPHMDDVAFAAAAARLGRGDDACGDAQDPHCTSCVADHVELIEVRLRCSVAGPRRLLPVRQGLLGPAGMVEAVNAEAGERVIYLSQLSAVAATVRLRAIRRVAVPTPEAATSATDAAAGCGRSADRCTRRPGHADAPTTLLWSAWTSRGMRDHRCALRRSSDGHACDMSRSTAGATGNG